MAPLRSLVLAAGVCLLLAAAPARAQDPVIAAAGDISCDPNGPNFNGGNGSATLCHMKATSDLLIGAGLSAVLPLGDLQYENGTLDKFNASYALNWGRAAIKSITRPAIGNHEYQTKDDGTANDGSGYWDYFNGVGVTDGPAGERGKGYYSFDVGEWHLIALNSMCNRVPCGEDSPQEQWLRADLAANQDACTLAYWHHPLWNSGPDGNYHDTAFNTTALWQALYEDGAELILNGHAHSYERFAAQDPSGNADPQQGIREFIVGTGGKSLRFPGTIQPNSQLYENDHYGVLKLVLKPNSYDWAFVNEGGTTVDSGSTNCHAAPPVDTTPPDTSIASGPEGGRRERDVSYSFVSSEAGSFRCRLDGPNGAVGNESPCTSPVTYTGLADGAYTFHVNARDNANNVDPSAASRSFTVDTAAPDTSITSGPEGTTESTSAAFSFDSTEAGSTFECRIDSGAFAGCGSPATYDGLAEGGHTFETRAIDALGNVDATPAARAFTVDPPEATVPDPVDDISLKHFRPAAYEITAGDVFRGRGARRRLFVDDGDRLEIAAAEKRSGRFVSSFESFMAIGRDARSSLRSMTLTYSGCTSKRGAKVVLSVFNHRTDKWVKAFTCTGRRERSFDWDSSAFARDYFTRNGTLTLRVKGKHDAPFRTRTDLLELAASI